jgi:hypothetical protein
MNIYLIFYRIEIHLHFICAETNLALEFKPFGPASSSSKKAAPIGNEAKPLAVPTPKYSNIRIIGRPSCWQNNSIEVFRKSLCITHSTSYHKKEYLFFS